jgi:hypothetical protein
MARRNPPRPIHVPGTQKGEELARRRGKEPGREEGSRCYRSARDSTAINAEEMDPIDPRSPCMPPP